MHLDSRICSNLAWIPNDLKRIDLQELVITLWAEGTMPYIKFRNVIESHKSRRLPINTVVLPPLEAGFKNQGTSFIANIMVNKSKSSGQDLVTVTRASLPEQQTMKTDVAGPSKTNADGSRVLQLEHNIRFLQDQHTLMLAGLHNEIDVLRNKNRELQFQLIYAKGTPSTPSSPDDETKQKLFSISPKQINATSLQVEILEKELGELRLRVQEVDAKNAALSLLVEEQKCKLNQYEHTINTYEHQSQVVVSPTTDQLQMLRKLDDADTIIRLLRRENSDLRRDVVVATSSANVAHSSPPSGAAANATSGEVAGTGNGGNDGGENAYGNREYHRDGGGRSQHHQHHRGGRYHHYRSGAANYRNSGTNSGNNGQTGQQLSGEVAESNNWFPPLFQQPNYWTNNTNRTSTAADLPSPPQNPPSPASSSLPSLQQQQQQQHNHRRSGHNNNHNQHYSDGHSGHHGGGHRKYHNKGHHNRSGKGNSNGGDKSN